MEKNKKWGLFPVIVLAILIIGLMLVWIRRISDKKINDEKLSDISAIPNPPLKSDEEESILGLAEVKPLFPGCDSLSAKPEAQQKCAEENLLKYIYSKVKYPQYALDNNIEGRCVITFVIEKDGKISHAKILKDIGGGCGEEALRVVNSMNELSQPWIPGKNKGQPIRFRFNLPIKFQLEKNEVGKK